MESKCKKPQKTTKTKKTNKKTHAQKEENPAENPNNNNNNNKLHNKKQHYKKCMNFRKKHHFLLPTVQTHLSDFVEEKPLHYCFELDLQFT
jgi:hypothetical protein